MSPPQCVPSHTANPSGSVKSAHRGREVGEQYLQLHEDLRTLHVLQHILRNGTPCHSDGLLKRLD